MQPMFRFDEVKHEYWYGIKRLPSVTQIINPLCNFSAIPKRVLEHKADLGTAFHESIALYLRDDIDESTIDERIVKPFGAFKEWWGNCKKDHDIMYIEKSMYHPALKFAGTPDLVTVDNVIDFKLRPYNRLTDPLQLEAYSHMVSRKKLKLWTVCFDLNGGMRIHQSHHPHAWGIFRRLLEKYYYDLEFNDLIGKWKSTCS